jgi:adenylate kinase family enzyme
MRITIVGLPGSGKSTLARAISEKLGIPHIQLDRFWFEAGGRNGAHDTPNIEAVRKHVDEEARKAIAGESWVSDGFYSRLQPDIAARADVVIYLSVPLTSRILNHLSRTLKRGGRHPEVSFWDDVRFLPEILKRTFRTGPKLRTFIAEHPDKVVVLRSRKEIAEYLNSLYP